MTTIDTLLFTNWPPAADEVSRVDEYVVNLGGKGMVAALCLFHLGCKPRLLSLIGPRAELDVYLPPDLNDSYLMECLEAQQRTWIAVTLDQQVYTFVSPSQPFPSYDNSFRDVVSSFLQDLDILYVTAEHLPLVNAIVLAAVERRIQIVTNLSWAFLVDPTADQEKILDLLLTTSNTLLLNEAEALEVNKRTGLLDQPVTHAPALKEIIITSGARGGRYTERPFTRWFRYSAATPEQICCVVGAGDTFNGAYIKARFIDQMSVAGACGFAAEVAGVKVSQRRSALSTAP